MIDFPGDHSWVGFGVPMYQAIFCELQVVKAKPIQRDRSEKKSNSGLQWFREKR